MSEHTIVKWLLRLGLWGACALMLVGAVISLVQGRVQAPVISLSHLWVHGEPASSIIALGVFVLALTPVLRVAALVILWARERDYRFALVALAVMTTLSVAIFSGHGG